MKPHASKTWIIFLLFLTGCSSASPSPNPEPTPQTFTYDRTVVSLTFDDGNVDNYQTRPMLAKNGIHATFYVVSGFTGMDGYMTADQLRGLYEDGNEIGGHTLNHTAVDSISGDELKKQICEDRSNLLTHGFNVTSFAYPYGHYNDESLKMVGDCGYNSARVVTGGPESLQPENPFTLRAMPYVVKDTRLPKMLRYIKQVEEAGGGWVIFTFHHVCYGCNEFAVEPEVFSQFADWLGEQKKNGLTVKTVGEVIGGQVKPVP